MTFYKTIPIAGQELKQAEAKAKTQEDLVYAFFRSRPESYTPFDIQTWVLPEAPITSVRRALTNLTLQGKLVKTPDTRLGRLGKVNHLWTLAEPEPQRQLNWIKGDK